MQIILIIILGFTVYGDSIKGKFVWDDYFQVRDNVYIRDWANLHKIFSEDIASGAGYKAPFYRPVQALTYMLDYSFYHLNPGGFHLTNILLHISVALVIYWLVNLMFSDLLLSFLASGLFVVHPANTEAVALISDRAESLGALFMLLCLIFYIKYLKTKDVKMYFLLALSFILALLSKENSIILPILLLLYHYVFQVKLNIKEFILPLAIALGYFFYRAAVIKSVLVAAVSPSLCFQRIPGFFAAITDYLRLSVFPFNLHMEYSYRIFQFSEPKAIIGVVITFLLIIYAFIKRNQDRLITFSIFWFFITLLPVSNIYPINESYMAERWLYFPSIGLILIFAYYLRFLYKLKTPRWFSVPFIIAIIIFYSLLTIKQNKYWREPISFYKRTLEYNPKSWRVYNELGLEHASLGKYEEAVLDYRKALEINPNVSGVYYNLAKSYDALKKANDADEAYRKAREINAGFVHQYYEKGNRYAASGRYKEAIESYNRALELDPNNIGLSLELGNLYTLTGKYKKAIELFRKALQTNPNVAVFHNNIAVAYYFDRNYDLAVKHCDRAVQLGYSVELKLLDWLRPYRKQE